MSLISEIEAYVMWLTELNVFVWHMVCQFQKESKMKQLECDKNKQTMSKNTMPNNLKCCNTTTWSRVMTLLTLL